MIARVTIEPPTGGWAQSFPSELPEPYRAYISFEGEAASLLNYECLFVPGLLQTEPMSTPTRLPGGCRPPAGAD
jgi:hypothetical protein